MQGISPILFFTLKFFTKKVENILLFIKKNKYSQPNYNFEFDKI